MKRYIAVLSRVARYLEQVSVAVEAEDDGDAADKDLANPPGLGWENTAALIGTDDYEVDEVFEA